MQVLNELENAQTRGFVVVIVALNHLINYHTKWAPNRKVNVESQFNATQRHITQTPLSKVRSLSGRPSSANCLHAICKSSGDTNSVPRARLKTQNTSVS